MTLHDYPSIVQAEIDRLVNALGESFNACAAAVPPHRPAARRRTPAHHPAAVRCAAYLVRPSARANCDRPGGLLGCHDRDCAAFTLPARGSP